MTKIVLVSLVLAALLLSGCGKKERQKLTEPKVKTGTSVTVTGGPEQ